MHREHREKIENEKSLSIFKKILCLVFPIPLSVRSVFSVVKILAGTAGESRAARSTEFRESCDQNEVNYEKVTTFS